MKGERDESGESGMSKAFFIGGPIDGQERILQVPSSHIDVAGVAYNRLFAFDEPVVFIYSTWDVSKTLFHLWHHYTDGKYVDSA
jgi:hypothetical protein